MGTESRSSRRRRRRSTQSATPKPTGDRLLLRGSEPAAAGLLAGFVLLLVGIALLSSSGTSDGGATTSPGDVTTSPSDTTTSPSDATTSPGATTGVVQTATSDEEALQYLARRSIEVLPAGQWPSLYDSFTSEFQQRCSRDEFGRAGEEAATQLGENLKLLRFKRTETVTIEGSSAEAVIVGEIVGQGEYEIRAVFQKEAGGWKIAPAPDTQGCEAFLSS